MRQLFGELKRRNVYRVAVTYAVVAFVTLQAARLILPATILEGLYDKLVFLAFVGFPIALVIAWAFKLTPEVSGKRDRARGPMRLLRRAGCPHRFVGVEGRRGGREGRGGEGSRLTVGPARPSTETEQLHLVNVVECRHPEPVRTHRQLGGRRLRPTVLCNGLTAGACV